MSFILGKERPHLSSAVKGRIWSEPNIAGDMAVLLAGAVLLASSFLVQLVAWRVFRPRRQLRVLLTVYAIAPLLPCAVAWAAGYAFTFSAAEVVRIALFYVSFSLAYFVAHCAIDSGSPTLDIVVYVAEAGPSGRSDADLASAFGLSDMTNRFALVEHGGMMWSDRGVFQLTPAGRFYARLFEKASRVFGLPSGG